MVYGVDLGSIRFMSLEFYLYSFGFMRVDLQKILRLGSKIKLAFFLVLIFSYSPLLGC
jgi:hypothetical protein